MYITHFSRWWLTSSILCNIPVRSHKCTCSVCFFSISWCCHFMSGKDPSINNVMQIHFLASVFIVWLCTAMGNFEKFTKVICCCIYVGFEFKEHCIISLRKIFLEKVKKFICCHKCVGLLSGNSI